MSAPINFVCWSSDTVTATIPTEAATPSKAVLLATHSPLRITRQRGDRSGRGSTEFISEQQVLDEFLAATPTNGVLVASVLGESGAGKSHLVRWVDANIVRQPGRHVIYLQKTETSLKDVIEKLLLDQQDPEFVEIRRRISVLGSGMTPAEMEQRILNELAEALRTAVADNPYAKVLVGDAGLMLLFQDPLFRGHLLRDGSFVKRRARYSLYGRDESESDVPLEFTLEELPLDIGDYAKITDAAAATRNIFRRLASNPAMQSEAVRLLNELLDTAVTKAASLNVGDVSQAFKKIREKFVGQEIVLLIEDMALIQGVRRDLLDAIVEVGIVQGVQKYATVRTMMAVTPGYYRDSLPDTFRTRAEGSSPTYKVDVEFDAKGVDEQVFVDFVGRYLNAARVGKQTLEDAAPAVPNKCMACQFQSSCHAAFGESRQGYGLYPYNKAAILRAVRACADRHGDRVTFNPRRVLSRAVRDVLNDNVQAIGNGTFPPPELLSQESAAIGLPSLPVHVQARIEADYPGEDGARLATLLTFWGRVGTAPIDDGVLQAFSHPPIPADLFDVIHDDVEEQGDKPAAGAVLKSVQKKLDAIDAWVNGATLPQGLASELRTTVREALVARVEWFDPVIREPDAGTLSRAIPDKTRISYTVSIDGASESLPATVEPIIRIKRDAQTGMMFRGLVFIEAGHSQRAGDALSRLDAIVAKHVGEAQRRIVRELAVDNDSLIHAAASLIRGAAACGQLSPKPKDLDYVNAALWRDPAGQRPDAAARAPEWLAAYRGYVAERAAAVNQFLRGVGAAQGDGGVHAVDIQRLTLLIRKAKELASSEDELTVPEWCDKAHRRLKDLTRTTDRQIAHWQGLIDRIRTHLPEGVTWVETVDALVEAVKAGHGHGFVKVADLSGLVARNDAARSWDPGAIKAVERLLETAKAESGMPLLSTTGTIAGEQLPDIAAYLEFSARWVEAGMSEARDNKVTVADIDERLKQTITTWLEIVKDPDSHD